MDRPILTLNKLRMGQLDNLIIKSHDVHMDLNKVVDWSQGIDKSRPPKRLDCSNIYGTRQWDVLTDAQRIEMLWQEVGQTASQFIWLEEALNPLFIRLLHKHQARVPEPIREYMMIFCKEEIVHTQMFRRFLKMAGLPLYGAPGIRPLFEELAMMHPAVGVLCVYLGEALAEEAVMRQDGPGIDPLTRQLFYEHHKEEARHLAFGRSICDAFLETAGVETKARIGAFIRGVLSAIIPWYTYSADIAEHLSFDIGIDPKDADEIRRVQLSPNNQRLTGECWGHLLGWLRRTGLVAPDYDWFDPAPPRPQRFAA